MARSNVVFALVCFCVLLGQPIWLSHSETRGDAGAKAVQELAGSTPTARGGFVLEKEYITERKIPTYILYGDQFSTKKRPVVILVHGGSVMDPQLTTTPQCKDVWFDPQFEHIPYRLAGKGIMVMAVDGWWAGERYKPEYAELVKASMVAAVFRGYRETAEDISRIVDYLATRPDADVRRVGAAGRSGGGISVLMAACIEPRLEAVVAWKAGANFLELSRRRGEPEEILDEVPGLREELKRVDPVHLYRSIPPKALALINNRNDPLMPREGALDLYERLKPLYREYPERLKLELLDTPAPTHRLQPEAYIRGCEWLEKFLLPEAAATEQSVTTAGGPAEERPVAKPGFVLKKEYITERRIPTYILYAEQFAERKKPVVISVHGGGTFHPPTEWPTSRKEMWFRPELADGVYRLAGNGFMVMMIDGWWGGERYKPEYAKLVEENPFAANFRGWRETAEDISRIIDHLATRADADEDRVGMMGASGGGITGLMAACTEPRLKAVVAWMAACDLAGASDALTPGTSVAEMVKAVPGLQEEIEKFDAAYAYEQIPPIALAIINNKTDPVIPYEKAQKLYEKLKPLYTECPDRLKFELLELPKPKHGLPPEGFINGYEWLERFLLEQTPAAGVVAP